VEEDLDRHRAVPPGRVVTFDGLNLGMGDRCSKRVEYCTVEQEADRPERLAEMCGKAERNRRDLVKRTPMRKQEVVRAVLMKWRTRQDQHGAQ
jgi:hypothetical protein